ncbi:hypothetical protein K6119_04620 [Paracrocinitomix mangrovi]|uniref:hypothetical protein n=1 Tax=Paracrocinitomix mangrovi TaxID=2862509 RepID=UPI001C8E805C|nr:hypothetical protein [Paracrocinitomix mangrovi]UKN02799.1 hypothetical protein K6119_04620 [Paracrocinitomix mangrovi]
MRMTVRIYSYCNKTSRNGKSKFLEFYKGKELDTLLVDLVNALESLNAKHGEARDFWFVDEVSTEILTELGDLAFTVDGWGITRLSGPEQVLQKVDELLQVDPKFENVSQL